MNMGVGLLAVGVVLAAAGAAMGDLPEADALPSVPELPDPLVMRDGTRVTTAEQWRERREELKALFEHYMYGHFPPAPGKVAGRVVREEKDGAATVRMVRLSFGPGGRFSINLSMVIPPGKGPHPVVLYLFRGNQLPPDGKMADWDVLVERGYIAASYANGDLVRDDVAVKDSDLAGYEWADWGVLAAWAWGLHRCVDYLETVEEAASDKIAVSGHSRRGKAALLAAAFDERIALAAPSGSGTGGTEASRFAKEGIAEITRKFPQWFARRLKTFGDCVERLPVDQHMLMALVAPRACLSKDALGDNWVSPEGVQRAVLGALPVYRLLGSGELGERLGLHFRAGKHDITREDWGVILDFCDQTLLGKATETRFDRLPVAPQGGG